MVLGQVLASSQRTEAHILKLNLPEYVSQWVCGAAWSTDPSSDDRPKLRPPPDSMLIGVRLQTVEEAPGWLEAVKRDRQKNL